MSCSEIFVDTKFKTDFSENIMDKIYDLAKPEREEEILKKLIYFIQCDMEEQSFCEADETEISNQ